jgi:hypothetical protein
MPEVHRTPWRTDLGPEPGGRGFDVHVHDPSARIDEDRLTAHPKQREHASLTRENQRLIAVAEEARRVPGAEVRLIAAHRGLPQCASSKGRADRSAPRCCAGRHRPRSRLRDTSSGRSPPAWLSIGIDPERKLPRDFVSQGGVSRMDPTEPGVAEEPLDSGGGVDTVAPG